MESYGVRANKATRIVDCSYRHSYVWEVETSQALEQSEQLIRTGRFEEAIVVLRDVLAEDPTNMPALLTIGIAYTESGRNNEAIQTMAYYVSRNAENDEAFEVLGCAHLRKGEIVTAEHHLRTALRLNPSNASVMRNLSVLLSRTDRGEEAFRLLERSYELNPQDYLTLFALAGMHNHMGHRERAQELYHTLLSVEHLPDTIYTEAAGRYSALLVGW